MTCILPCRIVRDSAVYERQAPSLVYLSLHRGRNGLEGIFTTAVQGDDGFAREIRRQLGQLVGNLGAFGRSALEPGAIVTIDDRKTSVDGTRRLDFDPRWHLELPAVVRGDQHQQLVASFGQPKQGDRAGKPAMVGVRILAATLSDIRA